MDNLSIAGADISSLIGALELNDHLGGHHDGTLEASGSDIALGPTGGPGTPTFSFQCASDGALESAGTNVAPAPYPVPVTFCCGPVSLQISACGQPTPLPRITSLQWAFHQGVIHARPFSTVNSTDISSLIGALELTDELALHDDGSLEASGAHVQLGMTVSPATCAPTLVCRIDDGVLESAGASTAFGPDPTYLAYGTARCCPPGIFSS